MDEAYSGMYIYAADVFLTGKEFRLEVYDAREPAKMHRGLIVPSDYKLIQQIRRDLEQLASTPAPRHPPD